MDYFLKYTTCIITTKSLLVSTFLWLTIKQYLPFLLSVPGSMLTWGWSQLEKTCWLPVHLSPSPLGMLNLYLLNHRKCNSWVDWSPWHHPHLGPAVICLLPATLSRHYKSNQKLELVKLFRCLTLITSRWFIPCTIIIVLTLKYTRHIPMHFTCKMV